jgi:hypothetical protein
MAAAEEPYSSRRESISTSETPERFENNVSLVLSFFTARVFGMAFVCNIKQRQGQS